MIVRRRFDDLLSGRVVSDPLNVFVKNEPHTNAKLSEGRVRLISGVSLVDTLVDRVLFSWLSQAALRHETPCMVGWAPVFGGWRYLMQKFSQGKPVLCLDKSSWDWTVQGYMVNLWVGFISDLMYDAPPWFKGIMLNRFRALFRDVTYQFKDGSTARQCGVGIMKSGCYLTLLLNSVSQTLLHMLAFTRMGLVPTEQQPIAIGDDTVQETPQLLGRYIAEIEGLGAKVKGVKLRAFVEFAGFCMNKQTAIPSYWEKHLFKLQFGEHWKECLYDYQFMYANEPDMFRFLQSIAMDMCPEYYVTEREAKIRLNGEAGIPLTVL